ncbi:MAG: cytidylate kinase family protein, partial [Alistipes sp.]|nr:cytidylate kinase family protein [Alistipes sp.]
RIVKRTGWSEEEAAACIERTDAQRARYYNYYTTRRWGEASTYDLTINTSRLGDEATAELILTFIHRKLNL